MAETPLIGDEVMKTPTPEAEEYDLLVLGSGEAGKYIPWALAKKGMNTTEVLVFGNRRGGTPLMQANQNGIGGGIIGVGGLSESHNTNESSRPHANHSRPAPGAPGVMAG